MFQTHLGEAQQFDWNKHTVVWAAQGKSSVFYQDIPEFTLLTAPLLRTC